MDVILAKIVLARREPSSPPEPGVPLRAAPRQPWIQFSIPRLRCAGWMKCLALVLCGVLLYSGQPAQAAEPGEHSGWRVSPRKAKKKNPVSADARSIALGLEIYRGECESCHGVAGLGDGSKAADLEKTVPDLTDAGVAHQSDGALFWKLTLGRKPMPGYRKLLDAEERWHLVNYLRVLAERSVSVAQVQHDKIAPGLQRGAGGD